MTTKGLWTEDHGRAVAEAALVSDPDPEVFDRVWGVIEARISPPRRPRRRVTKVAIAGAATAVVVGIGSAAAAGILSAHTGKGASDQEDLRLGGPGERLNLAGDDLASVIAQITRDIPFPSQRDRQISNETQYEQNTTAGENDATAETADRACAEAKANALAKSVKSGDARARRLLQEALISCEQRRQQASGETDLASTGAFRGWAADDAICSWANSWSVAVKSGDAPAKRTATTQLLEARWWPAVSALDTKIEWRSDGEESRFGYLFLVESAAQRDDVSQMAAALTADGRTCIRALVPDVPQAAQPQEFRSR